MSEREYVEIIRQTATEYVETLRSSTDLEADHVASVAARWHGVKTKTSPHTIIRLCNAYLAISGEDDGS